MEELNKTINSEEAEKVEAQENLHNEGIVDEEVAQKEAQNAPQEKKRAVCRKDMTKAQWTWREMKKNKVAYLMIAPFMFVFLLFTAFPVVLSLILSFTNFNMLELKWDMFIGIDNYTRLFLHASRKISSSKNNLV